MWTEQELEEFFRGRTGDTRWFGREDEFGLPAREDDQEEEDLWEW